MTYRSGLSRKAAPFSSIVHSPMGDEGIDTNSLPSHPHRDCARMCAHEATGHTRRETHRSRMMNQAAGSSDGELRQRVRDGLSSGKLFRVDGNGLVGRGTQQRCRVCNRPVLAADIEIRIEEPRQAFAHVKCYAIWLEESKAPLG